MKSKISFFNKTIFWKNVTLYWPIWVIYSLFLLGGLPINLWFSTHGRYSSATALTDERMFRILYGAVQPAYYIIVIAFAAVIVGMALYSYLYKSQSANMIHALPVDRTELYGTNVISGLAFLIVPQIVTFILAVLVCLNAGITQVEYLGMWLLVAMVTAVIAFAFVTFCAFFTGQLVALPIYVVIVNFLAYAFNLVINLLVGLFAYGVEGAGLLSDEILIWFSPIVCYVKEVNVSLVRDKLDLATGMEQITGMELNGIGCILFYLLVAVLLYVIAYFVYRARKVESAGDLITVGIVKPIFRWGVGTLCGYYATLFFCSLFMEIGFELSTVGFLIGLLIFGIIFYFVADMFVRKSFHVFKKQNWKGCGMFCVILLLSFAAVVGYSSVEEKRVPKLAEVSSATLNMGYSCEYTGEDVQKVLEIHEKILEDLDYYEKEYRDNSYYYDENTEWIDITYRLKNGGYVSRSYRIPYEGNGKKIIDSIARMESEPENFLCNLLGSNYQNVRSFSEGMIDLASYENKDGVIKVEEWAEELTSSQSKLLFEAIIADGLEGKLNKYNTYYMTDHIDEIEEAEGQVYYIYMETIYTEKVNYGFGYETQERYDSVHVAFGKDCKNIIETIGKLNLKNLDSVENIYWGQDEN